MNNPKVLGGAAVGIAAILWFTPGNPFNTPGVQNVGDAWSRGGGTQSGTPAISTPRGSKEDNSTPHEAGGSFSRTHHDELDCSDDTETN